MTLLRSAEPRVRPAAEVTLPEPPGREARELGQALGISLTVAEVLHRRGHRDPDATKRFLHPRLQHLTAPDQMADRQVAAERLAVAAREGERVCVFGDYDCDGITSTAILVGVLEALGARPVPLLASRFDGGYGLSEAAADRILDADVKLLVTCDCGSSDHEQLARLRDRGLEAIVVDHHLVPDEPLPAIAFLNPHRSECGFPYKHLTSGGLVLSLSAALRAELKSSLDLREWLDLVALGTVADVAPLDGDNRVLVRAGLDRLARPTRPGLVALMETARLGGGSAVTGEDIAFRLAPRLNGPGRLGPPGPALDLLLARSPESARALSAQVEQLVVERRAQQELMVKEAEAEVESQGWRDRPALVVGRSGWNHGIVGIVAARLVETYGCPVAAIGFDEQGRGRGSLRGPPGSRLHDALTECSDVLERFGGHQAAAGLEVREARVGELRERFEQACREHASTEGHPEQTEQDALTLVCPDDDLSRVVADLDQLEPCGKGNPAPRFVLEAEVLSAREVRGGHLKLNLQAARNQRLGGFGLGMGELAGEVRGPGRVVGKLRRDTYRGGDAVEIKVEQILR